MADFPKKVVIRGIETEIQSWEELDEFLDRYGSAEVVRTITPPSTNNSRKDTSSLTPTDRTLLEQFITNGERGILNKDLGQVLGAKRKGIRPALERWSRHIGLVTGEAGSAFEPVNLGVLGRGHRLTDLYIRTAKSMLGIA